MKSAYNKEKWLNAVYLPFNISHYCCNEMKKKPAHRYYTKNKMLPILATMASESRFRKQAWIRHGCNAFNGKKTTSQPMSFWTEQDVLQYIKLYGLEIASVYGDIVNENEEDQLYFGESCDRLHCTGCQRTGCIFCCFGAHLEKPGFERFALLAKTHPRQYEYALGGGQWVDNPKYDPAAPEYDGDWRNWNPKKIWMPSKQGLGLKYVIDTFNEMYPNNKIKY